MSIRDSQVVEPEVIEIRKYSNRRLYDTSASRYVTLHNVEEMIRQGKEIRVVDAQTGEDLTRAVMLQIICESKSQQELLPVSFLRQVIQASGKTVRSSIKDFLSLGLNAQKEIHQQFSQWMRAGIAMNPFMSTLATVFSSMAQQPSQSSPEPPYPPANEAPAGVVATQQNSQDRSSEHPAHQNGASGKMENEIEALRHQLALLQQQVEKLGEKQ